MEERNSAPKGHGLSKRYCSAGLWDCDSWLDTAGRHTAKFADSSQTVRTINISAIHVSFQTLSFCLADIFKRVISTSDLTNLWVLQLFHIISGRPSRKWGTTVNVLIYVLFSREKSKTWICKFYVIFLLGWRHLFFWILCLPCLHKCDFSLLLPTNQSYLVKPTHACFL